MKSIYSWFQGIYGYDLYDYLRGMDCSGDLVLGNRFITIGFVTLGVVSVITALYYFLRHARFCKIGSWFIVMAIVAVFGFFWGFGYTKQQYNNNMSDYHVYGYENCEAPQDEYGQPLDDYSCDELTPISGASELITGGTCVNFGWANMLIAICFYIILSIVVKRFSINCKHTPWKSVWPK